VITEVLDQNPRVLKRPRVNIRLIEFGDFAIKYEIRFWHANYAYEPQLKADLNRQLWYALRRNNIHIPFPIRDVFLGHEERKHHEKLRMDLQNETRQILEKVPILIPLSDAERAELASRVGVQIYGAGELIVKEGEAGDSMYIIRSGACDALKAGENERMKLLSTMRKGDFFGEISLLTGEKRSATIKANEDTSLIVIDKDVFSTVINANPLISEQIAQVVIERQQKEGVLLDDLEDMAKSSKKFIHKIKQFFGI
jgi:CRP-like cAMP-binding protein